MRFLAATVSGVAFTAGVAVSSVWLSGQGAPQAQRPSTGQTRPDFNGIWMAMNGAHNDLEPHVAKPAYQVRPGPAGMVPAPPVLAFGAVGAVPGGVGVVEGGLIPYKPEALKVRTENREKWSERDPEIKCYLPGIPRANYMPQPFQIVQGDSSMMFAYQYADAMRQIHFKDPGPAPIDSWMGQSVGRWEGNALVVDVTGLNDQTWFDRAGNFHSDQLKVTERFTKIDKDHLQYEATITDPLVFTRPWKISMPLYRQIEPNARLMEFKCVEFVEELMFGQWRKVPLK
ncbi:MAG: hypothetical protein FJW27_04220 [Acidimicrobiia bacterium]|nr:hypothetical protein [Acidimicrobiia bacterium]